MSRSSVRRSWVLVALLALAGSGGALGVSCSGDADESTRPEPPPGEVDAGEGADLGSACPESAPKVGDNCRGGSAEETCSYDDGMCTVEGQTFTKVRLYRCFDGNWINWDQGEKSPCDQ
jgi:hypothetical protein